MVIHPDGKMELIDWIKTPDYAEWYLPKIQTIVGGYIEGMPIEYTKYMMYFNEEGKLLGLPYNHFATIMAQRMSYLGENDSIVGTVVLVPDYEDGEDYTDYSNQYEGID